MQMSSPTELKVVYLGAGCFWCTEAVFQRITGVRMVLPGYMGGHLSNPSYEEICSGQTGHAEVIEVRYDEKEISFSALLEIFFQMHDPTTLNRQGADVGTQYRSAVFTTSAEQADLAHAMIGRINQSAKHPLPLVTEVTEATTFYPAEDYHQNYYQRQPHSPYCRMVIEPKLHKLSLPSPAG